MKIQMKTMFMSMNQLEKVYKRNIGVIQKI